MQIFAATRPRQIVWEGGDFKCNNSICSGAGAGIWLVRISYQISKDQMGHDGMVMVNENVHSFIWKECNYCTSVCFEWNGDGGCDTDFPFFYHLWILINYSNYFLWYQNISYLTKKNKMNKT